MERTDRQIYEEFTSELCSWPETGLAPAAGNQDIVYGLNLEKKRLEKYGLRMTYELLPREDGKIHMLDLSIEDSRYRNRMVSESFWRKVSFYRENRKCLAIKDKELLYTIITRLEDMDAEDSYCCPNCGAISGIKELQEGCPYCHTRFLITDLFPKVTNYYYLMEIGMEEKEGKSSIRKWLLGGAAVALVFAFPEFMEGIRNGGRILPFLSLMVSCGGGALLGYFALSFTVIFRLLKACFEQGPKSIKQLDARRRLIPFMEQYDPTFSFE